jgi:LuxR family maltose regulon positive regulatory protein
MVDANRCFPMPGPQLLVTKFTIPPLRAHLLAREHLVALLNQSSSAPLILVSASAGSGKSTLLSAWAK